MPWSGQQFASRHNHSLAPHEAEHAAHIANAILRSGKPEGIAIAVANKLAEHHRFGGIAGRDAGGSVDPTMQGIGGAAPSNQTQNPVTKSLIQRYSALPVEKLAELQGMMGGTPQGQIIGRILQQKRMQPNAGGQVAGQPTPGQQQVPQQQPAATQQQMPGIAQPMMRRGGGIARRDAGGGMAGVPLSMADPWWTRQEASSEGRAPSGGGGFLGGSTMGRADAIKTSAPAGAYVLPADVVAGLGDGNSMAGAKVMDRMLETGPHGIPMPRGARGAGPPRPPRPMAMEAKGGGVQGGQTGGATKVALSHGEYVVAPWHVINVFGRGSLKRGHAQLDRFVLDQRKKNIEKLKKLPGPVRSAA